MGRALALVALLASLCLAGPAGATFPGKNGRLAFAGTDLQAPQLGSATVSGARVPLGPGDEPVPSPDGTKIAFVVGDFDHQQLWVENANGSGRTQTACEGSPSWAPDSRRLACVDGLDVVVLDTSTGQTAKVAEGYAPVWSPEGSWIAYLNEGDGLSVVHPDGSGDTIVSLEVYDDVSWAPDGTKLAFTSPEGEFCAGDEGQPHSVWVVVIPDGTPVELPTDDNTRAYGPVFSPDSSRVAYVQNYGGPERCTPEPIPPDRVFVAPATGGGRTAEPCEDDPAWSPDATRLACVAGGRVRILTVATRSSIDVGPGLLPSWAADGSLLAFGGTGVTVVRPDGSDRRTLVTAPDTFFSGVRWLQDSTSLVYASATGGLDSEIFTSDDNGSGVQKLTSNDTEEYEPVWSPNGKRIAYVHDVPTKDPEDVDNAELYVMNADGSHKQRLTRHPGFDWEPSWSRDGKHVVFVRQYRGEDLPLDLAVVDVRTHRVRRLTKTYYDESWPSWSPNGRWIAFVRGDPATLHLISPTGRKRRLIRLSVEPNHPTWSPDSKRIAFEDEDGKPWSVRVNGKGAKALGANVLEDPAWSPDGQSVIGNGGAVLDLATGTFSAIAALKPYDPKSFDWQGVR